MTDRARDLLFQCTREYIYAYIPVLHNIKPLHDFLGVIPLDLHSIALVVYNPVVKIRQLTFGHRKVV